MSLPLDVSKATKIDQDVFIPLTKKLADENLNIEELRKFVCMRWDLPKINNAMKRDGMLFEAHIKKTLSDLFGESYKKIIHTNTWLKGSIGTYYRIRFDTDKTGSTTFYSVNSHTLTEIDALYTYHDSESEFPIIFESSLRGGWHNEIVKTVLVGLMYGMHPYLCKIRPQKNNEAAGLYVYEADKFGRKIVMPRKISDNVIYKF